MWLYDCDSAQNNPCDGPGFVRIVHMCYIDNLPDWSYTSHQHGDAFEVAFIVSGSGSLVIDSQTIPIGGGSISLITPGTMHHFMCAREERMCYYTLRFIPLPGSEDLEFFSTYRNALSHEPHSLAYVKSTMQLLFRIHQSSGGKADKAFQTIAQGLIQLARLSFEKNVLGLHLNAQYNSSDILLYISEHYAEKITLESLAKQFHVSSSHLSRIFCNAYHISPINYLINTRISLSTDLLLKTDLSIGEIAEKIGYDNPAHYTNMFTKRIGCSPKEYREQNQRFPLE